MARFALIALCFALACLISGCASSKIYPASPYTGDPKIEVIAVAPFLVSEAVASTPTQPFPIEAFQTSDGRLAFYSVEFAKQFGLGLTEFPGVTVVEADRVRDAWKFGESQGLQYNPMATRDQAMAVARALKADAIIIGQVMEWDPFVPTLTLHWSMFYTKGNSASAADIRAVERSGTGGGAESSVDYNKDPVYTDQLTLNAETQKTKKLLGTYANSLTDLEPYRTKEEAVTLQPFPRYVRFASWVAMCNAYSRQRGKSGGK